MGKIWRIRYAWSHTLIKIELPCSQNIPQQRYLQHSQKLTLVQVKWLFTGWRDEAIKRLDAAYALEIPTLEPRTKWIGNTFNGAVPVGSSEMHFHADSIKTGLRVFRYNLWRVKNSVGG